jgi:hypothetical protein
MLLEVIEVPINQLTKQFTPNKRRKGYLGRKNSYTYIIFIPLFAPVGTGQTDMCIGNRKAAVVSTTRKKQDNAK